MMAENVLYYGDNLDILRRYIKDETIDLVYLDPPFKSNQDYNVLFAEKDGARSSAQIKAFEDTWQWDQVSARAYQEVVEAGGKVSQAMQAFHSYLGPNDMLAYLAMMAPRLVGLRRVLKPTGSIYLHCDPTASHYLKILMDSVFGPQYFRNEVVWRRTSSHNDSRRFADINDRILYFAKTGQPRWNLQYAPHDENYVKTHYNRSDDDGRRYRLDNIIRSASMGPRPNLAYEYKGYTPKWGWRVVREKLEALDTKGRVKWSSTGIPYLVRYLDEMRGVTMPTIWDDIPPINSQATERLGYPTQKPIALLERIIKASSNEGDTVLDPFCGCGTTIVAAQRLKRQWIGIDITHLAINLMKRRLLDSFGEAASFRVIGEPTSVDDAQALADQDKYQFQWWALGLVDARPAEQKKGADKGIDGHIYFHDEVDTGKTKQVIIQVKAGHTGVAHVRDLRGVLEREKAAIGVLITMEEPSTPMRVEAADAAFYRSPGWNHDYPRIQLLTIAELLGGKKIDCPPQHATFKQAPKAERKAKKTELGL